MEKNLWKIKSQMTDDILLQAIELDKLVFDNSNVGDFDKCKEWLSANNNIYTILTFNDRLIGYINFMPITDDCYCKFISGEIKDLDITKKDILTFNETTPTNCLFASIAVHPDFQNSTATTRLWNAFKSKLISIQNSGFKIKSIIMDCVTKMGEKLATKTHKSKYIKDSKNGKIYSIDFD